MEFQPEKMEKIPVDQQFLDINDWWYFPNKRVVMWLYPFSVTANQITAISLIFGILSFFFYLSSNQNSLIFGSAFLYAKLFLDNIDGPLARVRGQTSRLGRFFDSFTDFVVNILIYIAISNHLFEKTGDFCWWAIGITAFACSLVQCSLFVYYLVQYTALFGTYDKNRTREIVTAHDLDAYSKGKMPPIILVLQRFHEWAYDWQDQLIEKLDTISRRLAGVSVTNQDAWYSEKWFLTLASPLCLCTQTMGLVVFSLVGRPDICFLLLAVVGNFYLAGIVVIKILLFRKRFRKPKIPAEGDRVS